MIFNHFLLPIYKYSGENREIKQNSTNSSRAVSNESMLVTA